MPVNDTDKLLVNDGSKTETITFAQFKEGTVLNDSDKFLINDGTKTETITWAEIEDELGPNGTVNTPTVLKPEDGAGSGTERDVITDAITKIEGGGVVTCETELIESVAESFNDGSYLSDVAVANSNNSCTNETDTSCPNALFKGSTYFLGTPGSPGNGTVYSVTYNNVNLPAGTYEFTYRYFSGSSINMQNFNVVADESRRVVSSPKDFNTRTYSFTAEKPFNTLQFDVTGKGTSGATGRFEISVFRHVGTNTRLAEGTQISLGYELTFPSAQGFDCFEVGDLVQAPDVKVVSKDDSDPFTIGVGGGIWFGTDLSGVPAGSTKLSKAMPYDTKLTLAGAKDLDILQLGDSVKMGLAADVPYQPVSDSIVSVLAVTYDSKTSNQVDGSLLSWDGSTNLATDTLAGEIPGDVSANTLLMRSDGRGLAYGIAIDVCANTDGTLEAWESDTGAAGSWTKVASGNLQQFGTTCSSYIVPSSSKEFFAIIRIDRPLSTKNYYVTSSATTLTLASDQDLAYFRKGDVVQNTTRATGTGTTNPNAAIDGDTNQYVTFSSADATLTVSTQLKGVTKLEAYAYQGGGGNAGHWLYFNAGGGEIIQPVQGGGSYDWQDISACLPSDGNVSSIVTRYSQEGSGTSALSGFRYTNASGTFILSNTDVKVVSIDDTVPSITVDGGEWSGTDGSGNAGWNQDEVWSAGTIAGLQPRSTNPITNGFDGNLSTEFETDNENDQSKVPGDFLSSITLPAPVTVQNTVEIIANGLANGRRFYLNNDTVNWKEPQSDNETLTFNFTGQLEKINVAVGSFYTPNVVPPLPSFRFKAIKVDGNLLVDQGIAGAPAPGEDKVTCQSPLKAPTDWTVEKIEGNTLSLSHATPNDSAQVWVANDNQAGTDFYVQGGKYIDQPLLTTNVRLESSEFSTTPATDELGNPLDGLTKITWSIKPDGGAEMIQDAGLNNPYTPTGLSVNTWHTIKVKHEGLRLGESEYSASTRFQTGASRSLKEHYMTEIRDLQAKLEAAEAEPKRRRKKAD